MGASKRKRQSPDSAIADMSSEDSLTEESHTQASTLSTSVTSREEITFKRHRGSFDFDVRDFETAASQRPRRGASRQPTETIAGQSLPQQSRQRSINEVAAAAPQATSGQGNGNNENPIQTPQRKQASFSLPTPPQTAEMSNTRTLPQGLLRRSTCERRPTERSQQRVAEQETPCKQTIKESASTVNSEQVEGTLVTQKRKSRIVRLRLYSLPSQPGSSQMSLTGSCSYRQKSSQEQLSQSSPDPVGLHVV